MQTLDVISVNLWNILISLTNLLLLYLMIKKFMYNPVRKTLEARKAAIDTEYSDAENAKMAALAEKEAWEEKIRKADSDADEIIKNATDAAKRRSDKILSDANEKADGIIRVAEMEASLEKKKAEDEIKQEIIVVSTALAEKMLAREVKADDHKALINSFIENIGDNND